jgi:D-glycero-alpha-D-manno-heptose-7-phosphate kinase
MNFIEFNRDETRVERLALAPATLYELQYALIFAYVGGQHFSSHIIERQIGNFARREASAVDAMDRIKQLAYEMRRVLEAGDVAAFGSLLHEGWQAKKRMADGISNPRIDAVYESARAAGALGGKVSGAGGGGFMFFVTDPARRFAVQDALREQGAELVNFTFVEEGMRAWNV